jgi:hypothetical protein
MASTPETQTGSLTTAENLDDGFASCINHNPKHCTSAAKHLLAALISAPTTVTLININEERAGVEED